MPGTLQVWGSNLDLRHVSHLHLDDYISSRKLQDSITSAMIGGGKDAVGGSLLKEMRMGARLKEKDLLEKWVF